ncbi:hypothetical protein P1113_gp6 [Propionibacterium phage PaP11-13]|nr:hypothetical protein P1113_gp6 [Propionibacterium phage PaP11-13]
MNKKKGYTIAGATVAIIAAASFLPAPGDNPPLASQPAPQATTANTEWTPKTVQQRKAEKKARQAAAVRSLQAEQQRAHQQAQARGEETSKGITATAAAIACNTAAKEQAGHTGVKFNGNPVADLQAYNVIGANKDQMRVIYGAQVSQPGATKATYKVRCQVSGTPSQPHVDNLSIVEA